MNTKETKSTEQVAVHKWIMWAFNYTPSMTSRMLREIAASDYDAIYLRRKLASYGDDWNKFYCECDSTLRKRMVDWLMANYNG